LTGVPKGEQHTYGHAKHTSNSVRTGGKLGGGIAAFSTASAGGNGTNGTRADDA
jgi:hypothetical protein